MPQGVASGWTRAIDDWRRFFIPEQSTHDDENEGFEGGRYARTEQELYEKAIALLEKCKVEDRR
jgi:hypothetical protein